jgi:hypothetical protein
MARVRPGRRGVAGSRAFVAARLALAALIGLGVSSMPHGALANASPVAASLPSVVEVVADRDDDDGNGVPDGEEAHPAKDARVDAAIFDEAFVGATLTPVSGGEHARLLAGGHVVAWGTPAPSGASVQGVSPGLVTLDARRGDGTQRLTIAVIGLGFRDGAGRDVDLTASHASIDRAPPSRALGDASSLYDAPDPLRVFVATPHDAPPPVTVESVGVSGAHVDALAAFTLSPVPCGAALAALHCFASEPIRFVIDEVDRRHALASGRSLRAELGGAIVLRRDGRKEQALRVLGPRDSPVGPIGRLRASIRPFVLRLSPGGAPAIGGDDAGAVVAMRAELASASAAWAECGVSLGPPDDTPVHVVDPPPPHLLALGNDLGLPASGGHVRFRIDGTKRVDVTTHAGQLPGEVARAVARAVEHAGFKAVVSPNARVGSGANPSVDVSIRRQSGLLAHLAADPRGAALSDDATLIASIGAVDLSDGLGHFGDVDSVAGTLEERTLLKAFDDGDPSTVEVIVIPFFTGGGRIGESFIGTDRSSLRNVVILDRAGIRARRSSFTLAHELGHVLLDVPGHPDDYGTDTPTRLMDADASDASPFGPRRLTLAECARVVRESGPAARSPVLRDWPLAVIHYVTLGNGH